MYFQEISTNLMIVKISYWEDSGLGRNDVFQSGFGMRRGLSGGHRIIAWTAAGAEDLAQHPARELFEGRKPVGGEPTCYVCANQQCQPPVTEWAELENYLGLH
jgi:hypothetical protein